MEALIIRCWEGEGSHFPAGIFTVSIPDTSGVHPTQVFSTFIFSLIGLWGMVFLFCLFCRGTYSIDQRMHTLCLEFVRDSFGCLSQCWLLSQNIIVWVTCQQQKFNSYSSGGWQSKVRCWHDQVLVRTLFPVKDPHVADRGQDSFVGAPLLKALVSFMRTSHHDIIIPLDSTVSNVTLMDMYIVASFSS